MNGEVVEIPATSCGKPTWCNSDALLWKKWAETPGVEFELAHWVVASQIRYRSMVTVRLIRIQPPSSPLFEASLGGCSGLSLRFAHASVGPWTYIIAGWYFRLGEGQVEDWLNGTFVSKFVLLRSVFENGSIVDFRLCETGGMHWLGILRLSRYLNGLQKGRTVSVIVRKVNKNGINSTDCRLWFSLTAKAQKSQGVFFRCAKLYLKIWRIAAEDIVSN